MILKIIFKLILLIFLAPVVSAQDAHVSQFYTSPLIVNPAFTGNTGEADFRTAAQFRNQWSSLTGNYVTSSFAFDAPFKERWGLGGYIMNNDASQVFNVFNFVLSASYDVLSQDQDKHELIMGLQLGLINKGADFEEFTFDSQYDEGIFNPFIASGESLPTNSILLPEVVYGLMYRYNHEKYTPFVGLSAHHLTYPRSSFLGTEYRLPLKYSIILGSDFILDESFIARPLLFSAYQKANFVLNTGAEFQYDANEEVSVMLGVMYRLNESIIPIVGVKYQDITFRFSYDINVSPLNDFTRYRGGAEFSLIFQGDGKEIFSFAVPR